MTKGRARISVVMAARDSEATIGAALASLYRQTLPPDEIVVVDDASTDGTVAVVRAMADHRLRILRNDAQRGVARSLNRALAEADGDLVARMDADDISAPARLETQAANLSKRTEIALVGCWVRIVDERTRPTGRLNLPVAHESILGYAALSSPFRHPAMMIRRSALEGLGTVYDPAVEGAEDYDLWARLLPRHRAANIPLPLLDYRVHARSVSVARRALQAGAHAETARRFAAGITGRDDLPPATFDRLAEMIVLGRRLDADALEAIFGVLDAVNSAIARAHGGHAARQAAAEQHYVLARGASRLSPAAVGALAVRMTRRPRAAAGLRFPLGRDLERLAGALADRFCRLRGAP